jgi:hypothetical protein
MKELIPMRISASTIIDSVFPHHINQCHILLGLDDKGELMEHPIDGHIVVLYETYSSN